MLTIKISNNILHIIYDDTYENVTSCSLYDVISIKRIGSYNYPIPYTNNYTQNVKILSKLVLQLINGKEIVIESDLHNNIYENIWESELNNAYDYILKNWSKIKGNKRG